MQVLQLARFCLGCLAHFSPEGEAVGFPSWLLLLNTSLVCHIFFPEGSQANKSKILAKQKTTAC